MAELFTREQARKFLRENKLRDAKSIEDAFSAQIGKVLQEVLEEEMENELGYSRYDWKNKETENARNGHTKKTVKTKFGNVDLKIPRDVNREFEPAIVKKHERRLGTSVEDRVIGLFAKGVSTRDIHDHMKSIYGLDVSAEMVTRITDKILPIAKEWQNRPLEPIYPILYLDGVVFGVRQDGQVTKKTAYVVYGLTIDGMKDVLGIWIGEAESSKFWMKVLVDLKNRGVKDILIASVDGLPGFSEAIESVFPKTEVQQCVIHQIRNSTRFVSWKDRKPFCASMKEIYTAANEEAGLNALDRFEEQWDGKYSYAVKSWRDNWPALSTFFKYPEEIRKIIYTTNPLEGFNRRIRKTTKTKGAFPTDDSLFKLLYLIVIDASKKWTMPIRDWGTIVNQLRIYFGERMDEYL